LPSKYTITQKKHKTNNPGVALLVSFRPGQGTQMPLVIKNSSAQYAQIGAFSL
jgi:hypothetical protein